MKELVDAILKGAALAMQADALITIGGNGETYIARVTDRDDCEPFVSAAFADPEDALRDLANVVATALARRGDELAGRAAAHNQTIIFLRNAAAASRGAK